MEKQHRRKSQKERRMEMRARLFEATLSCLERWGYHGATLSRILDTAGVSRGAWRHHFATKDELVAAAAEFALNRAVAITRALAHDIPPERLDLEHLFDFIWKNFYTGRHRAVWLEFNVACRTNAALRERLAPVLESFHASMEKAWEDVFTTTAHTDIPIGVFLTLSINTLRGMAVQSIVQDDQDYYKKLRRHWISVLTPLIRKKTTDVPR